MEKVELLEELYKIHKDRADVFEKQVYELGKEIAGLKEQLEGLKKPAAAGSGFLNGAVFCTWPNCTRNSVVAPWGYPTWQAPSVYGGDGGVVQPDQILYCSESPRSAILVTGGALLPVQD